MSARDYALTELDRKRLPGWPADLLRKFGHKQHDGATPPEQRQMPAPPRQRSLAPTDPRDRALAEQIVIGVVKNHLHLRHLILHYAGRSLKSIDPLAQKILSIALYQLRFLTRIPASAAVNEAVNQAKRFGRARASGFINAVLRKAASQSDVPLPDRAADPAGYAELVLSQPRELFEKLRAIVGTDTTLAFCEHDNREPPTIVRLFSGRTEADLRAAGVPLTPHEQPRMFIVDPRPAVLAQWAEAGIAQVQDPTAAAVVPLLQIEPDQQLLDRCCGLGTKTLQMQDLLGNTGHILAIDPSEQRTRILRRLIEHRHIPNVTVRPAGMLHDLHPDEIQPFDSILIDAPCSNSGVLARRPEARYAQQPGNLLSLRKLQNRILDDTAPLLKTAGRIVYSTCSIWPEENEQQIAQFLSRHSDFRLVDQRTTLPSLEPDPRTYHDAGYYAVLTRA